MFRYEILRDQWIILALFGGTALVLYLILFFYDYHTPRKTKEGKAGSSDTMSATGDREQTHGRGSMPEPEYETRYRSAWQAIPWGLRVTILLMVIYAISYSIYAVLNPYSW